MKGFSLKQKPSAGPTKRNAFDSIQSANHHFELDESVDQDHVGEKRLVDQINDGRSGSAFPKEKLVIPAQPNKEWANEARKRSIYVPGRQSSSDIKREPQESRPLSYGLNIVQSGDASVKREAGNKREVPILSDEQIYNRDIVDRPEEPDMEAYKRVPVEEFGAALLRGMGWKGDIDPEDAKKEQEAESLEKKRPAFLGLGAKSVDNGANDSGAWGKGAPKRHERSYIPVAKRDIETGEIIRDEDENETKSTSRNRSRSPSSSERPRDNRGSGSRDYRRYDSSSFSGQRENRRDKYSRGSDRDRYRSESDHDRYRSESDRDRYHDRDRDRYRSRHDRPRSYRN